MTILDEIITQKKLEIEAGLKNIKLIEDFFASTN